MGEAKTKRRDPFKNFRFRVKFSGGSEYMLGVSKVTGFKRTTEVIKHRAGGDPATSTKLPGRTEFDPIVLERGVTTDKVFEQWANRVWSFTNAAGGLETSLKDFRQDLIVDVFNEGGQKVLSYQVFNCWVSEWQPVSDLDANANAVAIQHIRLENEGWVREDLPEPADVSFTDPVM
ncbi:phage tail protein [Nocardia sp. CDC159]|uniref:Phage tail protein n=1 Tax=Nocardia pulmonis TaxID=2951408 RepID=A0A9X2ECE1_9NOCA|nr:MULTISPECIES: phage tail protein [Nocardia]MCM6776643.1 phage tail protein [Nocardia pulmonis]MCM6789208.1 phage tail protein [Nocardia sp. CDC159]